MGLTPKSGSQREPMDEGTHGARLVQIIDLGTQDSGYKDDDDEPKMVHNVRLTFEFPDNMHEFMEGEGKKPAWVSSPMFLNLSYGKKATLYGWLSNWQGKKFTENIKEFDLFDLLNAPALVSIKHREKDGEIYENISAIASLPKGMKVAKVFDDSKLLAYSIADHGFEGEEWEKLPEYLQERIEKSVEFGGNDGSRRIVEAIITKLFDQKFKGEVRTLALLLGETALMPINSSDDERVVQARIQSASDFLKRLNTARMAITKPLDNTKKKIMAKEKEISSDLEEHLITIKIRLDEFYAKQLAENDAKSKEAKEIHDKAIENANTLDDLVIADIDKSVSDALISDGERGFSRVKTLEIWKLSIIPRGYLIVNEKLLLEDLKNGVQVPGANLVDKARRTGR